MLHILSKTGLLYNKLCGNIQDSPNLWSVICGLRGPGPADGLSYHNILICVKLVDAINIVRHHFSAVLLSLTSNKQHIYHC